MNETRLLAGSLSNDLFRVASMAQRGADSGAKRFLIEAKRWAVKMQLRSVPKYIAKIADDIVSYDSSEIPLAQAEKFLMYGILLQNFTVHSDQFGLTV